MKSHASIRGEREDTDLIRTSLPETAKLPLQPASASNESEAVDTAALIGGCLEDMKAEDTVVIDLVGKTAMADRMIITSGRSQRHVGSIADKVVEALKAHGRTGIRVEGMPHCDWVLIDAGDVVLHVFRPEVRNFYNLEKMWGADRPDEQRRAG
jgi:ribosome-associated protein